MKNLLIVLALIVIVGVGLYLIPHKTQAPTNNYADITNFQTCADAGFPITESDPAVCTTPDNRSFTEQNPPVEDASVLLPQPNTLVHSPLQVTGSAVGSWYFEATFPAVLKDDQGNIVAQGPMRAQSDWMTTNQVPFAGTLTFSQQPQTATGMLILSKDNPSGLPQNDASIAVPVKFKE
jgi:hypothetical protein